MSVFPGFGGWNNQNSQQSPKAESKRSENVESNSEPPLEFKYYDKDEVDKQVQLWIEEDKKYPWKDAPPKVKENKSRKLLMKDGPRRIAEVEKVVSWKFLWFSGALPISLIVEDNQKDLTGNYKKKNVKFMKVFEGRWKVEPLFIDSERLCKQIKPKSREEYKKCSGGRGRIASKVTMEQIFQPSFPLNLPPFSWIIRGITIKTTKNLLNVAP
ncbi:unnamed protein product [Arabidopsis halleri]